MQRSCPVEYWCPQDELTPARLTELKQPVVFQGKIETWDFARSWTPQIICSLLGTKLTTFKVCPRRGSRAFKERFDKDQVLYETQCKFVEATFRDFHEWISEAVSAGGNRSVSEEVLCDLECKARDLECKARGGDEPAVDGGAIEQSAPSSKKKNEAINPLLRYPSAHYWIYADYKYMFDLCETAPELTRAVDWGCFGLAGRDGTQSTLWIGSQGADTPCHYDTYGCNLVAQLSGKKRWVLFSPDDSACLYPTRVPFEESSVFSSVNVLAPNILRHPRFVAATAREVTLCPGDVLYVPRHWWHYVECVEDAVSVNTWLELPSDDQERLKEALVRSLVSVIYECSEDESSDDWINPNEVIFPHTQNLQLLSTTLQALQSGNEPFRHVTSEDLISAVTDNEVVHLMASRLQSRLMARMTEKPMEP